MKFKPRMINAAIAAALGTVAGAAQAISAFMPTMLTPTLRQRGYVSLSGEKPKFANNTMGVDISIPNGDGISGDGKATHGPDTRAKDLLHTSGGHVAGNASH